MPAAQPLTIDAPPGLVAGVRQVLSPHFDARPGGAVPDLIVVHGISLPPGEFGGPWIDRLFTGNLPPDAHPYFAAISGGRVSAHALIRRDGRDRSVRSVFGERAWHAGTFGVSAGARACNDFSIGIELEGTDEAPYDAAQYDSARRAHQGAAGSVSVAERASASSGHSDVAPGRKTDPGAALRLGDAAR